MKSLPPGFPPASPVKTDASLFQHGQDQALCNRNSLPRKAQAELEAAEAERAILRQQLLELQQQMTEMNSQLAMFRDATKRELHFSCTLAFRKRPVFSR